MIESGGDFILDDKSVPKPDNGLPSAEKGLGLKAIVSIALVALIVTASVGVYLWAKRPNESVVGKWALVTYNEFVDGQELIATAFDAAFLEFHENGTGVYESLHMLPLKWIDWAEPNATTHFNWRYSGYGVLEITNENVTLTYDYDIDDIRYLRIYYHGNSGEELYISFSQCYDDAYDFISMVGLSAPDFTM
jgi:hypothetical protein